MHNVLLPRCYIDLGGEKKALLDGENLNQNDLQNTARKFTPPF